MKTPRRAALAAVCTLATVSGSARANGRFPSAQYVVVGPGTTSDTIAIRTTFGVVVSDDGGRTFRFLCEEAFQYVDGYDPSIALNERAAILVGVGDGVLAMDGRCAADRVPTIQNQAVIDLTNDPSGRVVFAAVTSPDVPALARVARSTDGGRTFHLPDAGLRDASLESVEVAPSNALRVYATAADTLTGRQRFLRSDDAGETLRATGATLAGVTEAFVSAVDPERPDVVYVRATFGASSAGDAGAAGTALLRSDDGGETFRELARTLGPMRGFALSGDGSRVWIGGPDARDGVQLSTDGGAFARVSDMPVDCLRYHAGALYACGVYVRRGSVAPEGSVLLARSDDGGRTMVPLVRYTTIQAPAACAAGTIVQDICQRRWRQVQDFLDPQGASGDGGMDARVDVPGDAGPPGGGGCGPCAAAAGARSSSRGGLTLVAAASAGFGLRVRRRRRRRPRPRG